jgi:hypothetical protein
VSSGQQQIVALGGAGLIVGNFWLGPERRVLADGLFHSSATDAEQAAAHAALKKIGGSVVFLLVATIMAGISNTWGRVMAATVLGLLLVWAVNATRPGGVLSSSSSSSSRPAPTVTGRGAGTTQRKKAL